MRSILVLAVALAWGCGATPNRGGAAASAPIVRAAAARADADSSAGTGPRGGTATGTDSDTPERILATVAGQPVLASELVEAWVQRDGPQARQALEDLILQRLAVAEARRLGMQLDPALVEAAMAETRAALEEETARNGGGLTLEEAIRRRLGLDPGLYLSRLQERRHIELLTERCVRAWILGSERVDVRVIVVGNKAKVEELRPLLAAGEDFAGLARRFSLEDSAVEGGRIPPVVRGDTALARLAFSTPIGEVGGPLLEQGQYLFLLAERRPEPLVGDWSRIGTEVEASLHTDPVESPEFWQWKGSLLERYEVDMSPFMDFTGLGPSSRSSVMGPQ